MLPDGYEPAIDLKETQIAIKIIKDFFQRELAKQLHLTRVSAPLIVLPETGLNDNLNGVERPVKFGIRSRGIARRRSCTPWQNGRERRSRSTALRPAKGSIRI